MTHICARCYHSWEAVGDLPLLICPACRSAEAEEMKEFESKVRQASERFKELERQGEITITHEEAARGDGVKIGVVKIAGRRGETP